MSAESTKVMKMLKDNDVKYVDFRFTDPRGKWQHLSHHDRRAPQGTRAAAHRGADDLQGADRGGDRGDHDPELDEVRGFGRRHEGRLHDCRGERDQPGRGGGHGAHAPEGLAAQHLDMDGVEPVHRVFESHGRGLYDAKAARQAGP